MEQNSDSPTGPDLDAAARAGMVSRVALGLSLAAPIIVLFLIFAQPG